MEKVSLTNGVGIIEDLRCVDRQTDRQVNRQTGMKAAAGKVSEKRTKGPPSAASMVSAGGLEIADVDTTSEV